MPTLRELLEAASGGVEQSIAQTISRIAAAANQVQAGMGLGQTVGRTAPPMPVPTATPYPPQNVPVAGYPQPVGVPGEIAARLPQRMQLAQPPAAPPQYTPYHPTTLEYAYQSWKATQPPEVQAKLPANAYAPKTGTSMTNVEMVQNAGLAGMAALAVLQPESIPVMAGLMGLSQTAQLPAPYNLPGRAVNLPFQAIEKGVAKVVPEETGVPLAASYVAPLLLGLGLKYAGPKIAAMAPEAVKGYVRESVPVGAAREYYGEAPEAIAAGAKAKPPIEPPIEPPLPTVPEEVLKAAPPKEAAAIRALVGDVATGGKKPIAPIRIASTIGNDIMNAWNAVVRPAALRPVKVQGALENYATNLESTQFDAGLLTRRLARDYREVGFDTKATVNKIEGGTKAPKNLRGTLADIIENPGDYKLNAAQLKAIGNEQNAAREWIALQKKRGADISEIMTNYVRHVVDFEGSVPSSVLKMRRFPTLRELQTWIDENPDLQGKIRTLNWGELRQSSFEALGRAGDSAEMLRELAPLRWIKQRGARGRAARPPEGYRRVNLPEPFQGKTVVIVERGKPPVTTRVGDWYLPDEAAAALESQLGPLPGFLKPVSEAVEAARGVTLNLDFSIGTQFGANKLMGDPVGSLTQLRPMARGLTSAKGYLDVLEEEAPFVKMFLKGGGRLSGRFGEAVAGGEPKDILSRTIPGLQKMNDIQFTRIMGLGKLFAFKSQFKMLMAMRDVATKLPIPNPVKGWTDEQIIRGAARASMNEFGSIDYTQIGAGSVRRVAERMGLLTPGFMRAFVGLFAKTPSAVLGDPQGIAQAVFLAQYIGYMSVVTDAVSYAMGGGWQGAEHYDPRSSKFMTVVYPQGSFSPAGQIRTYARLLANLPQGVLSGNMDRINFFLQSRESQPFRTAVEQWTGHDLFGYPVETELATGKALTGIKAIDRFIAATEKQIPIAGQTLLRSVREGGLTPETVEGVAMSFLGLNFWPAPIRAKLDEAAKDKYGRPWRELEPFEKNDIRTLHPDLQAEADADLKDRVLRGDKYAVREEMRQSIFDDYTQLIADIPNQSEDRSVWRELYTKYVAQREAALTTVDRRPEFAKIAEKLEEREPNTTNQKLLAEYNTIFSRNRDPKTGTRTPEQETAMFTELDDFEATHTPEEMAVIDRNGGLTAPPWLKELREDRKVLRPYWDAGDTGWVSYAKAQGVDVAKYPTFEDYRTAKTQYAVDNNVDIANLDSEPVIKGFTSALGELHQIIREETPEIDVLLHYWYGDTYKTVRPGTGAAELYHERYGVWPREAKE